jgi:hypothetical protein
VLQVHHPAVALPAAAVAGDQHPLVVDLDGILRPRLDLHPGTHIPGRHRIEVTLHAYQEVPAHPPHQAELDAVRGSPIPGTELLFREGLSRYSVGGTVYPQVGHPPDPLLELGIEVLQGGKAPPGKEAPLDVLHPGLYPPLGARPVGTAKQGGEAVVGGEVPEGGVPHDMLPLQVPPQHHRPGVVVEDLLGQAAKPVKGMLMAAQQGRQLLILRELPVEAAGVELIPKCRWGGGFLVENGG